MREGEEEAILTLRYRSIGYVANLVRKKICEIACFYLLKKACYSVFRNFSLFLKKKKKPAFFPPNLQYHQKPLLHGRLDLEVRSAQGLPDMESKLAKLWDKNDVTDAYVDVRLGNAKIAKTRFGIAPTCRGTYVS